MKSVTAPIITTDKQVDDTITYKSLELYVDTSFRKEWHARQWGYMVSDFKDLKKGEKVYFHYLSVDGSPSIPPNNWVINYKMLYCVIRNDQIVMLNEYALIDIIKEEFKSGLIIIPDSCKKVESMRGIVAHTNHPELKKGDQVIFAKNSNFKNTIEGVEYYLMENQDLIAKIV